MLMIKFFWIIEYIFTITACLFSVCVHLPKPNKWWWVRFVAGIAISMGIWVLRLIPGYIYSFDILIYLAIHFIAVVTMKFTFSLDLVHSIFVVAIAGTLQHAVYKTALSLVSLINPTIRGEFIFLIIEFAVLVLGWLALYFSIGRKLRTQDFPINNVLTFAIAGVLATSTIAISFYTQDALFDELSDHRIALALINLLSVLLCVAGLGLLYESMVTGSLKEENYILHMLSRKDKERYELAKRTAEAIAIKYHDLKHAMGERTLDEEEKLELQKTETDYTSLMFSGNRALDLILIEKRRIGEERGVHIQAIVDGTLMNFMKSYQIYSMFGNLLDNAIEACEKLSNDDDRIIHLKISKVRDNVVVEASNKAPAPIVFVDGLPLTTKEHRRNHGFGMKSIRSVCLRYNGFMQAKVENGMFILKLVFPYVESEPNE